eukprot:TRINITY_DN8571_c0_g1_i1.p1 TRINITY_DN8571_c0_g1~~TRINITY_DN8571_c0_g1_i1.p1  ORF type:complete len:435 (-),score=42.13 TRINITY_DN8571_c0_g1_i1:153-1457(-)
MALLRAGSSTLLPLSEVPTPRERISQGKKLSSASAGEVDDLLASCSLEKSKTIDNSLYSSSEKDVQGAVEHPRRHSYPMDIVSGRELLNSQGNPLRKVLLLYTGGTIGMEDVGGSLGLVPGNLVNRLKSVEELQRREMPQCYVEELSPILDSADMCPADWCRIASLVERAYLDFDGFVILHGTDTMAYTASALSYMLENLAKPVILTGSQLPFRAPLSDARQNFLGAVMLAGATDLSEVCLFFGSHLLRGNRSKKTNASSLSAFHSPNELPLAELGTEIRLHSSRLRPPPRGRFRVHFIEVTQILVVWLIPGFSDDFFESLLKSQSIRGMVLMSYGCGNAPARKASFISYLREMNSQGIVVVACSQCVEGSVSIEKYAVGTALAECGVISAGDMTVEATVTKLSYLLSKGLDPERCRKSMQENLRGVILCPPVE